MKQIQITDDVYFDVREINGMLEIDVCYPDHLGEDTSEFSDKVKVPDLTRMIDELLEVIGTR